MTIDEEAVERAAFRDSEVKRLLGTLAENAADLSDVEASRQRLLDDRHDLIHDLRDTYRVPWTHIAAGVGLSDATVIEAYRRPKRGGARKAGASRGVR